MNAEPGTFVEGESQGEITTAESSVRDIIAKKCYIKLVLVT